MSKRIVICSDGTWNKPDQKDGNVVRQGCFGCFSFRNVERGRTHAHLRLPQRPQVGYKKNIYDCEDHAMEFKAYVAREQVRAFPQVTRPFCVGLAMGFFSWAGQGRVLHVANFSVLDTGDIEWFDLRARRPFRFQRIRPRLRWILV